VRTALAAVIAGIAALLTVSPTFAAPPPDIKAYCAGKWAEYRMQAFCIDQEQAAQRRLSRGVSDQEIWTRCYHKWDSWQMVDFCVKDEEKAKAKVLGTPAPRPTPAAPSIPAPSAPTSPLSPAVAPAEPQVNREALATCAEFARVGQRFLDGATTSTYQVEAELRSVYRLAERSGDRLLQQKTGAAISAIGSGGGPRGTVRDVLDYCLGLARGPAKPLTAEEIEQQTRRATEQSGGKKCETKVYGGGAAVTVCE